MLVLATTISVSNFMLVSKNAQFTRNFELCRRANRYYVSVNTLNCTVSISKLWLTNELGNCMPNYRHKLLNLRNMCIVEPYELGGGARKMLGMAGREENYKSEKKSS